MTLWAVDEGVLSLTGYQTPDPIDLLYQPRGLGLRLASNLTTVAPQVAEGEKGRRAPGGGGGRDAADMLRSRFQTTAFFLGSVVTDAPGNATATAKLPDNLTTFRVMAVAVTAGDRYGNGQSSLLVTRPLLARPALPRFVRAGDRFTAGVVVNRRDGAAREAKVAATGARRRAQGRSAPGARRSRPGAAARCASTSGPPAATARPSASMRRAAPTPMRWRSRSRSSPPTTRGPTRSRACCTTPPRPSSCCPPTSIPRAPRSRSASAPRRSR